MTKLTLYFVGGRNLSDSISKDIQNFGKMKLNTSKENSN